MSEYQHVVEFVAEPSVEESVAAERQDPIDVDHRNRVELGRGRCAEAGEPRSAVQAATAMA